MKITTTVAGGLTAAAALLCASAASAAAQNQACLNLPDAKVGLQLYSVRTAITGPQPPFVPGQQRPPPTATAEKLSEVFGRLQAIGWKNVENFGGTWGHSPADYRALLDRHGIRATASHGNLNPDQWTATLAQAKALGQTYVGSGGYGMPGLKTLDEVLATAANLDRMGEQARAQGLKLYVHNHQDEFKNQFPYDLDGDGRTETVSAWEIVAARTKPENVAFEIDIHWARLAYGVDKTDALMAFLRKHRDRIALLHVKDTTADGQYTDLGRGTTNWRTMLDAAGPQIAYYFWELDRTPDEMASAAVAYRFLTCKGG